MNGIKFMRIKRNMSQCELANRIGITQTTLSSWERGRSAPRVNTLMVLTHVLDCTVDDLIKEY